MLMYPLIACEHVVAALGRVRSMLSERGDRGVDEVGFNSLQVLVAEAEARQRADAEVLGHDVAVAYELFEELDALGRLELERDRELVSIPVLCCRDALFDAVSLPLDAERHALAPALP